MSIKKRYFYSILAGIALVLFAIGLHHVHKPLPEGLNYSGSERSVESVTFLQDITYTDANGERQIEQQIFNGIIDMIANAQRFILVDMFLFNDFQGEVAETHRAISSELTEALIAQKQRFPDMEIQVISDPLNTIYGGQPSSHFNKLAAAGIPVTLTDHTVMRDSNPLYSAFWRLLIQPFGNSEANTLPNPFGDGSVSVRSYLALLNFKANHRKVVIADDGDALAALVTSANPHDGSSAHSNVALRFKSAAVWDLLATEQAVLRFSGAMATGVPFTELPEQNASKNFARAQSLSMAYRPDNQLEPTLQIVTERAVERALLSMITATVPGEQLDIAAFYLSDRHVVGALKDAAARGVLVRVLLDANKDAFGRAKNGIPNRPVAYELNQAGIEVRWCVTQGEQCHAKWVMHRNRAGGATMLLGSTNFTRRNLHNLNLETSVLLRGPLTTDALAQGHEWFEKQWHNRDDREFSTDYTTYADDRLWYRVLYRLQEYTGLGTF